MRIESYGSICVEGGDQLGKRDATGRMVGELEREGVNITYASFPIYATPIGTAIRSLLKNGCPENILNESNNLEARMALFALNRLEFMDVYLSDGKYRNTLLVLDRSPYSNAVTIGYGFSLKNDWNIDEVQGYIDKSMDYDALMMSKLGLDRCVIQLKSQENEWKNIREKETDQYEKKEVQERCDEVYRMYKDIVGDGWREVVTKNNDGWRSRDEIWGDIKNALWSVYGPMKKIKQGKRYDIGFKEIVAKVYPKARYDSKTYSIYRDALKENVKDLMYMNGIELGRQVADSSTGVKLNNSEVRSEFRRIILMVPETMRIFEYLLGKNFTDNLKECLGLCRKKN